MLFHAEIGQRIGSAQCSASFLKKNQRHQQRGLERGAERNYGRIGTPMYARSLSRLFEYSIAFLGKAVLILVRRTYSGRWSGRRVLGSQPQCPCTADTFPSCAPASKTCRHSQWMPRLCSRR
jgi:hypothetical protein